jgi:hypothetical protein
MKKFLLMVMPFAGIIFISVAFLKLKSPFIFTNQANYKVGDCTQWTPELESWEKNNHPIQKILEIGKTHYRVQYIYSDGTSVEVTESFWSLNFQAKKVTCPPELKDKK